MTETQPKPFSRRRAGAIAVVTGALAVSACASGLGGFDIVTKVSQDSAYQTLYISNATAGGAPVEVVGAPGGDPQVVADALRLPGWFTPKAFTAIPPNSGDQEKNRFVLVFGAPENIGGPTACKGAAATTDNPTQVLSVYCTGDEVLTEARLTSPNLGDPTSPEFAKAMRGLFVQLLPPRNPEDRGDNDRRIGG